ncbi:pectinesterase inhibitor 9-like [Cynara cardunculus var. scolymus]|uniref:Pectinesterase inhibitor n=1 Tax=Cynara cardunculus var. scolymus TaxID=59895 RepID=A0A118JSX0_CYNCS|nr:pectinesterase inhibitor 9-like [Cynara cardunculus var. scolymus]KVH89197.1 Pectinesterase inhibitor [Cynara cardunculus var. scolymus]
MAHKILSLLIIFLAIFGLNPTVECGSRARAYVEHQCRSTIYTELCIRTLLPFVSKTNAPGPEQLARISLTTCLVKARLTKSYVNMVAKDFNKTKINAGYYEAMTDCLSQINDGVSQITQSVKEQQRMVLDGEKHFTWHQSNVQTWVSTALTDVTTCLDRISDKAISGKEKGMIKARVLNVKHLASNALALFNRFTTRHRGSRVIRTP